MIFDSIKPNTRYLKNHIGFSQHVGRRQYGLNSLCVAAAIMAVLDPQVIWDVGFQLSFAATLGLILYADRFTNTFKSLAARWLSPGLVERLAGLVALGQSGQSLQLGADARVRVLRRTDKGCALMIEMGSFRALLPGGMALEELVGENIAGPSVIILSPADLDSTSPEAWQALGAQAVISAQAGPWVVPAPGGWVQVAMDKGK